MRTITIQKIMALVLVAISVFLIVEGTQHSYYGRFGPGSGFFPIWVGGLLLVLSLALLGQSLALAGDTRTFMPDGAAFKRPLILAAACVVVVPALSIFGFRLTMFVFVALVPMILQRQRWYVALSVAAVASFGAAYLFERVLYVRLPHVTLPFLAGLGL
jgi:hypothetical protein